MAGAQQTDPAGWSCRAVARAGAAGAESCGRTAAPGLVPAGSAEGGQGPCPPCVRNAPKPVPAAHHIWCASAPGFGHGRRPMPGASSCAAGPWVPDCCHRLGERAVRSLCSSLPARQRAGCRQRQAEALQRQWLSRLAWGPQPEQAAQLTAMVREAARALSGYRLTADHQRVLDPRRHDPGPKTILGRTAAFDGESLAAWLAEQPPTPMPWRSACAACAPWVRCSSSRHRCRVGPTRPMAQPALAAGPAPHPAGSARR